MAETKDISDEEKKKQEEEKKKKEEEDKKKEELSNGTDTVEPVPTDTAPADDAPTIDERVIAMEDKVNALSEQMATIIDTINDKAGEGEQLSEKLADKTEEEKKKEEEEKKKEDKKELSDKTDDKVELSKRIDSMEKMLVKLSKTGTSKLNQSGGNKDPDDVIIENAGKKFGF